MVIYSVLYINCIYLISSIFSWKLDRATNFKKEIITLLGSISKDYGNNNENGKKAIVGFTLEAKSVSIKRLIMI